MDAAAGLVFAMFTRRPLTSASFGAFESAEPAAAAVLVVEDASVASAAAMLADPSDWGDESDDIFGDLGAPPPCGPTLVRQQATDATVLREAKGAALGEKVDAGGDKDDVRRTVRLIPQDNGSRRQRSLWM